MYSCAVKSRNFLRKRFRAAVLLASTFSSSFASAESLPAAGNSNIVIPKSGTVEITTNDRQGTVFLDDAVVSSTGSFQGSAAPGKHKLKIVREGFETVEKEIVVEEGKTYAESITLRVGTSVDTASSIERPFAGVYGGLLFGALFVPGGSHHTLQQRCSSTGAVSCDATGPFGGSFGFYAGYSFNPLAVEFFLNAGYDYAGPVATFDGVIRPGSNSVMTGPARTETFSFHKVGGVAGARVRYTVDGPVVRAHAGLGAGIGFRYMALRRDTTTTESPVLVNSYSPDALTYFSPTLTADLGVHFRVSGFLALTVGLGAWLENAGNKSTEANNQIYIVNEADKNLATPLPTSSYGIAQGIQFYLNPYIGLEFGP